MDEDKLTDKIWQYAIRIRLLAKKNGDILK